MGLGHPMVAAVLMFVPCLNVIVLMVLSGRATAWCGRNGIEVGLFGPTREALRRLQERDTA
jgi:hypothetical protein